MEGPLFFGNAQRLGDFFTPKEDPDIIEIHLRDASIFDYSGIEALNTVGEKYHKLGKDVHLKHINKMSEKLIAKAHDLVNFRYETVMRIEDEGKVSLTTPLHLHVTEWEPNRAPV